MRRCRASGRNQGRWDLNNIAGAGNRYVQQVHIFIQFLDVYFVAMLVQRLFQPFFRNKIVYQYDMIILHSFATMDSRKNYLRFVFVVIGNVFTFNLPDNIRYICAVFFYNFQHRRQLHIFCMLNILFQFGHIFHLFHQVIFYEMAFFVKQVQNVVQGSSIICISI